MNIRSVLLRDPQQPELRRDQNPEVVEFVTHALVEESDARPQALVTIQKRPPPQLIQDLNNIFGPI